MSAFATRLEEAAGIVQNDLSGLTDEQFNWKPTAESWSIAQCILHLVKTNKGYFPIYERLANGEYQFSFWEKRGWFNSFWAKVFVNGVDPKNVKKWKAPGSLKPTQSHIDQSISSKLLEQHAKLLSYYDQLGKGESASQIISSPFAKFITYPLSATFDLVSLHELRHLQQALRIKNNPGFPK